MFYKKTALSIFLCLFAITTSPSDFFKKHVAFNLPAKQQVLASPQATKAPDLLNCYRHCDAFRQFFITEIENSRMHIIQERRETNQAKADLLIPIIAFQEFKNRTKERKIDQRDKKSDQNNFKILCKTFPQAFQLAQKFFNEHQSMKRQR